MPTIDFKPVANGVGANVESQAAYVADLAPGGALEHGFQQGRVDSDRFNKPLRQSSMFAAALATFISQGLAADVLDNGDLPALTSLLTDAVFPAYAVHQLVGGSPLDQSAKFIAALSGAPSSQIITLPAKSVLANVPSGANQFAGWRGQGMLATTVTSFTADGPVFLVEVRNGSWALQGIWQDLGIRGPGGQTADGISFGTDALNVNSGRVLIERVIFDTLNRCFRKGSGNIGNVLRNCVFGNAQFGIWAESVPAMPAGVDLIEGCHFSAIQLAAAHYNSTYAPTAMVTFRDCVIEQCPGFVWHFENFSSEDISPSVLIENVYLENNATDGGNILGTPVTGFFRNMGLVIMRNTPLYTFTIISAALHANDCHGTLQLDVGDLGTDSVARFTNYQDLGGSCKEAMVESVASLDGNQGAFRGALRMHHLTTISHEYQTGLVSETFLNPVTFGGGATSVSVADGTLFDTCQELTFSTTQTYGEALAPTVGSWVVASQDIRFISAAAGAPTVQLAAAGNLGGFGIVQNTDWRTFKLMARITSNAAFTLQLVANSANSKVRLGPFFMREFATKQEALAALNSTTFYALEANYPRRQYPRVSADNGDADKTLTPGLSSPTQRWGTPLTAPRTATFAAGWNGAKFRVSRLAAATGASGLDLGGLITLAVSQWADIEHNGAAWFCSAKGALP